MSHDIYQILENLDAAQRSVKQLPALFKPKDTSPQLSGPYPGANATRGYLVGEGKDEVEDIKTKIRELETEQEENEYGSFAYDSVDAELQFLYSKLDKVKKNVVGEGEEPENAMRQAVTRRIVNQHPEWITRYGVEFLMQVIDDVTEGETDWEEIGSSDVSAYVQMVGDRLRDRGGDRSEIDEQSVAEGPDDTAHQVAQQILKQHNNAATADEDTIITAANTVLQQMGMTPQQIRGIMNDPDFAGDVIDHVRGMSENVSESATTEDVLSTVKKKLGDYLQDVATAIKKDPDLMAKLPQAVDDIKAVKTMRTADGHEIKITGNEDDGFRISIKNKNSSSKFNNLDEAVMAVEMYCARRQQAAESADYIEEKR